MILGLRCKIVGRIRPDGDGLASPFFRRRCVAYQLSVRQWDSEDGWRRLLEDEHATNFWVDDDTGSSLVHAERLDLHLLDVQMCVRSLTEDRLAPDEQEHLRDVMRQHGVGRAALLGFYRLEIGEQCLVPGSSIAVEGIPTHHPGDGRTDARAAEEGRSHPFRRRLPATIRGGRRTVRIDAGRNTAVFASDDPSVFG